VVVSDYNSRDRLCATGKFSSLILPFQAIGRCANRSYLQSPPNLEAKKNLI
jgi:hypothetical protein